VLRFGRRDDPHALVVDMSGVKMGDRLLQIGCPNGARLAAIASKVGLSGRAVAIVPDQEAADRARKGAANAGVLVEIEVAPSSRLPIDDAAFDLAIIDDTGGLLGGESPEERGALFGELTRALRPGGRVMVVGAVPRAGLGALLSSKPSGPPFDPIPLLEAGNFRSVRKLAEREGLSFVEGVKTRA
jgi:ubiquinone/menaquinone biosynthesis C-methylase UbiE